MRCKPQSRNYFLGVEVIEANAGAGLHHKGFAAAKTDQPAGFCPGVLVSFPGLPPEDIGPASRGSDNIHPSIAVQVDCEHI
jgi:hypothetical protein